MASLADLFNPSFFIILGIVALLIALMIVYFESKMREQNHKIASMLSLVSTLAEDINGVKMGLNHLAVTSVNGGGIPQNTPFPPQNLGTKVKQDNNLNLIEVSDDESDYDNEEETINDSELEDNEYDNETTSECDFDYENDDDENDENDDGENIKIIKLSISQNNEDNENSYEEVHNLDFDVDDLAVLDDVNENPEITKALTQELTSLKCDEEKEENPLEEAQIKLEENVVPSSSDLKTISINLGDEPHSENIYYKKLQLPKLRSIAVEKGLTTSSEAQKFKKPELLKLLGVE